MIDNPLLVVGVTLLCAVMIILMTIAMVQSLSRDVKALGRSVRGSQERFASEQQALEELSRLVAQVREQGEGEE
jgi:hypothetical protein